MHVIYILWLRQLKRYIRSRSRIVGALGQPILYLFALGYGLGAVFQKAGQGNYLQFLVPGIIAQTILFSSVFSGIEIIWDRQFGFLKETLVAPVPRFQIFFGRTLGGATVATFQGLLVLVLSFMFGFRPTDANLPLAFVCMFIISFLFTSLGTAVASKISDMQGFQLIMNFLIMPLFFLSGSIYPIQQAPTLLKIITSLDPLSYGVDGLRATLIHTTHFGLATDFLILTAITVLLIGIGSYLFEKIQI